MMSNITAQLADVIGADAVADSGRLAEYAIGPFTPVGAVRPADADGVAAVMAWAQRAGIGVYPVGGRTLAQLGNVPTRPGIALDLSGLNRLVDFQPADLTVQAQAGMTIAQLDAELAQDGKHVPLGAPLAQRATIGGTLATGISGPLRTTYGLPRDWLIGVSVVGADGTASKAGGQVVKNVTGYDLNRLYTGSLGTLAVITEATFKLAPAPTEWAAIAAAFSDNDAAIAACRELQAQPYAPQALHLLNPAAARSMGNPDLPSGYGPVAIAIIGGRPSSVRRRITDTALLWLEAASTLHIAGAEAVQLTEALADLPFNPSNPPSVCVRVNAPPDALPQLLAMEREELAGATPAIAGDVGFGGGRLLWWEDFSDADASQIADRLRGIQGAAAQLGGDAIVESCPASVKEHIDVWGPEPSGMAIMRRIKEQFDPNNILNPGRFMGGL
ncbi:MAG: FAD-binding oxidoreductase [Chloroflexi bacterium]|nr:FAD-binding oxidoreductase [Chloroflexota bacterium]MYD49534.1 FAD-binding oxidoreductase [Chloroflexota bacterium]